MEADERGVILEKGLGTEHEAREAQHALQTQPQASSGVTERSRGLRGLQRRQATYLFCAKTQSVLNPVQSSQRTFFFW